MVGIALGLILLSIGTWLAIAAAMLVGTTIAIVGGISATIYALRLARAVRRPR